LSFGEARELVGATTLTSCGATATLFAQAGDAVASGESGAVWTPVVVEPSLLCSPEVPPIDQFAYGLASGGASTFLTGEATELGSLASGGTRTDTHTLSAACAGSHGDGDGFQVAITYTATAG
jgi:hypothetical protein